MFFNLNVFVSGTPSYGLSQVANTSGIGVNNKSKILFFTFIDLLYLLSRHIARRALTWIEKGLNSEIR